MSGHLVTERFRAMGCDCAVAVTSGPSSSRRVRRALEAAREEVGACERALSRFMPDSDLARVNRCAGSWVEVDPRMVGATRAALAARAATDGRFDPTVLPALEAAGYDRSFERLDGRAPRLPAGWRSGAALEAEDGRVRVGEGTAIDLGGIAKGWSAERALEAMRDAWPGMPGGLVDLGGDIALWGRTPEGGPWRVAIADPRHPGARLATLVVDGGGVATSGRDRRRFGPGGSLHHLIDPATGEPARGGPLAVTVAAPQAHRAEAFATLLALGDLRAAEAVVAAHADIAAVVVPDSGGALALGRARLEWAAEPSMARAAR